MCTNCLIWLQVETKYLLASPFTDFLVIIQAILIEKQKTKPLPYIQKRRYYAGLVSPANCCFLH